MIAPSCPIRASELPTLDWEVPEDLIAAVFGRRQKEGQPSSGTSSRCRMPVQTRAQQEKPNESSF